MKPVQCDKINKKGFCFNQNFVRIHIFLPWCYRHVKKKKMKNPSFLQFDFFYETIGPTVFIFCMKPPWIKGTKPYSNGYCPLIKMAEMPTFVRTFERHYSIESKERRTKKLSEATGSHSLINLSIWWSDVDLWTFYVKVMWHLYGENIYAYGGNLMAK